MATTARVRVAGSRAGAKPGSDGSGAGGGGSPRGGDTGVSILGGEGTFGGGGGIGASATDSRRFAEASGRGSEGDKEGRTLTSPVGRGLRTRERLSRGGSASHSVNIPAAARPA